MENVYIDPVPTTIPVLNNNPEDLTVQIILAALTLIAILVALFQEKIKDIWNKAVLSPKITPAPPDCHQIDLHNQMTGEYVGKAIYIRIRVDHISGKSANNVEAIITKLEKQKENKWLIVNEFLPMNLRWSHTHHQTATLPPKSFRHCDLGSFRQHNLTNHFLIDTIVQPNPVANGKLPNLVSNGKYRLTVLFSGENVKPITKTWVIVFKPNWSNNETTMLSKNIKIYETK